MRKRITAGAAVLTALLLAGCSSQAGQPRPETETTTSNTATAPTTSTGENQSKRTSPAKSLQLANPCSIVTEQQWRALGADQKPAPETSNGKKGCRYQKGEAGSDTGWGVFIAADSSRTMQKFAKTHPGGKTIDFAGYPTYQADSGLGCIIVVDVSDTGSLFVNGIARPTANGPSVDPCPLFKKFAKAAIENLPNA